MVLGFGDQGDSGAKGIMGVIVFISVFVIMFSLLLSYAAPLVFAGESKARDVADGPEGFDASEYTTTNFYNTTNGEYAYAMTPNLYGTHIKIPGADFFDDGINSDWTDADKNLKFSVTDGTGAHEFYIFLYPIKDYNGDGDAFVLYSKTGWWDAHHRIISEQEIIDKTEDGRASFSVSLGVMCTVYFVFPTDHQVNTYLGLRSGFNVSIGQTAIDEARDSNGFWDVIVGLLTFNLPNGGTGVQIIDILLSTAFIASCSFIIFWAATRIL